MVSASAGLAVRCHHLPLFLLLAQAPSQGLMPPPGSVPLPTQMLSQASQPSPTLSPLLVLLRHVQVASTDAVITVACLLRPGFWLSSLVFVLNSFLTIPSLPFSHPRDSPFASLTRASGIMPTKISDNNTQHVNLSKNENVILPSMVQCQVFVCRQIAQSMSDSVITQWLCSWWCCMVVLRDRLEL